VASAFGGQRSIQLSYGRIAGLDSRSLLLAEFGAKGNKLDASAPSRNRMRPEPGRPIRTRMTRAAVVASPLIRNGADGGRCR
jgi:hypothetical protein